jgi:hypothetical protein
LRIVRRNRTVNVGQAPKTDRVPEGIFEGFHQDKKIVILFVSFVLFIWLNQANSMNEQTR